MAVTWDIHWPLTEGLGETLNNVGTLGPAANIEQNNCNWVVDGDRGVCLELDGVSGYLYSGASILPGSESCTFSFWLKPLSLPGNDAVLVRFNAVNLLDFALTRGAGLGVTSTDYWAYPMNKSTISTADSVLTEDSWNHVAVVTTEDSVDIYVNGASVKSGSFINYCEGLAEFRVNPYIACRLQNIRYSTGEATAQEIADLYSAESSTVIPSTALPPNVPDRNNLTLVFDESTGAWAKWDVGFDFLSGYRNSKYEYAILGARQGYVHELDAGNNDGASVNEGYATLAGDVTSGGVSSITDSSATFQTLGDGLAGCRIFGRATGGDWQERIIIGNYSTKLYVDRPFNPTVNEYVIAPIDFYWESRWMDLGDPAVRKRIYYLQAWLQETDTTEDITVKYKTEYDEDWNDTTLSTDDEFAKILTPTRGRKVKLRFEHIMPNEPVEIESFQFIHAPKRFN